MSNATTRTVKGVLGEKLGMTQVWDADNRLVPVTVIKVGPNVVTQVRGDADGYPAVQIGYGEIDPRKVNKPMKGHFERAGVTPRRHLVELRTADASDYALGQEITAPPSRPVSWSTSPARPRARASPVS
jgi:large subunit ribosomal protein L3